MNDKPKVVGHRGWPARFPDNTLAGFFSASTVADSVETDIRRSGDGKLVLCHDPEIQGLEVASTPWSVLGELDLGHGHRPALLDEAIVSVPGLSFQLEVKNLPYDPGFEPDHRLGLETAERAHAGDMVTSFNWATLAAVRRVFPDVETGVVVGSPGDIHQAVNVCLDVGHPALVPSIELPITGIERALAEGLQVYPWVADEAAKIEELADLGVSGIITDDPARARIALWRQP